MPGSFKSRVAKLEQRRDTSKVTIVWRDANEPEEVTSASIDAPEKEVGPKGSTVILMSRRLSEENTAVRGTNS